ncbi:hypothetical protein FDP41_008838 [Naegleria fowleri]|uniref:Uncharacterized protein n=1 Tax=Naegleria fowleri TaxID=5763 RepID=A0A6A5BHT0_NAEFO|nr:uncharacterized protein FDP41_008838 [Naegleria fowleri]KAF0972589.1 hypothetical protein FDP41_008838 [Naegleria fowleri]
MSELKHVLSFVFDKIFNNNIHHQHSNPKNGIASTTTTTTSNSKHITSNLSPPLLTASLSSALPPPMATPPPLHHHKILSIDAGSSKFKTCFFDLEHKDAFRCDEGSSDKKAMYTTVALIINMLDQHSQRIQIINHPYPLSHHVSLARGEVFVFFYNWKNMMFPITEIMTDEFVNREMKRQSNFVVCDERTLFINSGNVEITSEGVQVTITSSQVRKATQTAPENSILQRREGDRVLFSKKDIVRELFKFCFNSHVQLPNGISLRDCEIYVSIPSKVLFRDREAFREIISTVSQNDNIRLVRESVALCYYFHYVYYGNVHHLKTSPRKENQSATEIGDHTESSQSIPTKAVAIDIGHYSSDVAVVALENEYSINMTSAYCLYHGGHKVTIDILKSILPSNDLEELKKSEEKFWREVCKMNECKETIFDLDTKWNLDNHFKSGQDGCVIDDVFLSAESIKQILDQNFLDIVELLKKLVESNSSKYLILGGPVSKTRLFKNYVKSFLQNTPCEIVFTKNLYDICIGTFLYAANSISQPPLETSQASSVESISSATSVLASPSKIRFVNSSPIDHVFLFCMRDIVCTKVPNYIKHRYKNISLEMYNQMIEDVYGLEKTRRLNMYNLEDQNVLDIDTRQERPTSPIVSYLTLDTDAAYIDFEIYNATLANDSILKQKRDMAVKGYFIDPSRQRNYRRIYTAEGARIFGLDEMNFIRRVKIVGFPKFSSRKKELIKLMENWGYTDEEIDFILSSCRVDYQINSDDNLVMQFSNLLETITFNPIEIHTSHVIPCTIQDALSEEVSEKFDQQVKELVVSIELSQDAIETLKKEKSASALRMASTTSKTKVLRAKGIDIISIINEHLASSGSGGVSSCSSNSIISHRGGSGSAAAAGNHEEQHDLVKKVNQDHQEEIFNITSVVATTAMKMDSPELLTITITTTNPNMKPDSDENEETNLTKRKRELYDDAFLLASSVNYSDKSNNFLIQSPGEEETTNKTTSAVVSSKKRIVTRKR